jgi:hypothetical protein
MKTIGLSLCLLGLSLGARAEIAPVEIGAWGAGPYSRVVVQGAYAYAARYSGVEILHLVTPAVPARVGEIPTGTYIRDIAVADHRAYLVDGDGLQIIDLGNPAAPRRVGGFPNPQNLADPRYTPRLARIRVAGKYAYAVYINSYMLAQKLQIIDLSDPAAPWPVGEFPLSGYSPGIAVSGDHAYIANALDGGLQIVDLSRPSAPVLAAHLPMTAGPQASIAVSGNHAYVADGNDSLQIIDIGNPAAPRLAGRFATAGTPLRVAVSGEHAYVFENLVNYGVEGMADKARTLYGVEIVEISDPAAPKPLGGLISAQGPGMGGSDIDIAVAGEYAYLAHAYHGLQVIDLANPAAPRPLGGLDTAVAITHVVVAGEHAYLADAGDSDPGLRILDVANPAAPALIGSLATAYKLNHLAVSSNHAYAVDDAGLRIIDVRDPSAPRPAGRLTIPPGVSGLAVNGGYVYMAHSNYPDDAGLRIIDAREPLAPRPAGRIDATWPVSGVALAGAYVYLADGEGLRVIDVGDPSAPRPAGSLALPGIIGGPTVAGAYVYLVTSSGLQIVEVGDPSAPKPAGSLAVAGVMGGRNPRVFGAYAYLAADNREIRIIDISQPSTPVPAGSLGRQEIHDLALAGDTLYAAANGRLVVFSNGNQCATAALPRVRIPCVQVGGAVYRAELTQIAGTGPRFTVDWARFAPLDMMPGADCAVFPHGASETLRLNCLQMDGGRYWVEMILAPDTPDTVFGLADYGAR